MSTARKVLSNTVAQIIGKVIVAMLGLATIKIVTGYLTLSGIGQYGTIYAFLHFFGIAADLGLFTIAVKEMSADEKNIPKIIGNILSLRTILIFATMVLAVLTVFLIPQYQSTRIPLGVAIASITVALTILNGTITSVLQVKFKMGVASVISVLGKVVTLGFMIYVVFFGFPNDTETGFYMLLVAGIVGSLAMLFASNHYVRKITPLEYRLDLDLWKDVLWKSLPYGLALILNTVYFRIDVLLIGFLTNQEQVGIYDVAMKILEQFTILPLYFMNAVLPVLTKKVKEKSEQCKKIIQYAFDFLAAMAVPMVAGIVILAYPITFVAGDEKLLSRVAEGFYGTDIALQILIIALLFQFLNTLFAFVLIATDKQYKLLYINGACALFNVVTNIIFIPIYGFRGAAITTILSELFILIATYFVAKRALNFSINLISFVKITFSAIVMAAVVKYLQPLTYEFVENWNLLLLIPIGALVYTVMLVVTRTVNKEMLALLKK